MLPIGFYPSFADHRTFAYLTPPPYIHTGAQHITACVSSENCFLLDQPRPPLLQHPSLPQHLHQVVQFRVFTSIPHYTVPLVSTTTHNEEPPRTNPIPPKKHTHIIMATTHNAPTSRQADMSVQIALPRILSCAHMNRPSTLRSIRQPPRHPF